MPDIQRKCIYCGFEKPISEFSLEHIWPAALGGTFCSDLFKTHDVCERCNAKSGLWIDGEFLKSWFMRNELALSETQYMDPNKAGIASLVYLGVQNDFTSDGALTCERWLGPAGEHIYHVHEKDDGKWFGYAGGDIIKRKQDDAGRAYIVLTSHSEYWVLTALLSFAAHFQKAKRCRLTEIVGLPKESEELAPCPDATDETQAKEVALIRAVRNKRFKVDVEVRLDLSSRFLAKVALGLGFSLLGETFITTPYGQKLQQAFRERDVQKRAALEVRGTGFLHGLGHGTAFPLLDWAGGWVLLLKVTSGTLGLTICSPSGHIMGIVISDEPGLRSEGQLQMYQDGHVFLVIPQRGEFVGPIPLPDYLAHRSGAFRHAELNRLEGLRIDPLSLPDKMLPPRPQPSSACEKRTRDGL